MNGSQDITLVALAVKVNLKASVSQPIYALKTFKSTIIVLIEAIHNKTFVNRLMNKGICRSNP